MVSRTALDRADFARLVRGEPSAFAALFERYYDALCAFAEGFVASADEAEEVVAEVFVRIWERRKRLDIQISVKSYLYSATRNQALNHLRRRGTEERWLDQASSSGELPGMSRSSRHGVLAELHAVELNQALERAIETLPPRPREVFILHRRHGLTYAEIAETLGVAAKTVENHIGRALKALRTDLAPFLDD